MGNYYDDNVYGNVEHATDYIDQNAANIYDDDSYINRVNEGYVLHGFTC